MKKFLFLLLMLPLFVACGSDDDDDVSIITAIKLENLDNDILVGGEYQLKVTHMPSNLNAPIYTWESSDPDVASIDNTGKLKALKEGQVNIKVTAASLNLTSSINITILPIEVTDIKLDKQTHEITAGESFTLTYKIEPVNATTKKVAWKSSNESIATVDKNGLVTALSDGDVTITVSLGSLTDECKVKINPIKATSIVLSETSKDIEVLESFQLTATVTPNNAKNKNVIWKSSNESIASVDKTGKVSTKAVGTAIITATTEDGNFEATASINVYSFTKNITVSLSISTVTTPWGITKSTNGELKNDSKKTIIAKKVIIYENGALLSTKDINDTLVPGGKISYGVERHGNFSFVYEYEFDGVKYSTL